jgi:hypothetical protein
VEELPSGYEGVVRRILRCGNAIVEEKVGERTWLVAFGESTTSPSWHVSRVSFCYLLTFNAQQWDPWNEVKLASSLAVEKVINQTGEMKLIEMIGWIKTCWFI